MHFIDEAFVVLHIRISHIKILKFSLRSHILTFLIFLVIFHLYQLYIAVKPVEFLQAGFLALVFLLIALYWVKTWLKANRMLNDSMKNEQQVYASFHHDKPKFL